MRRFQHSVTLVVVTLSFTHHLSAQEYSGGKLSGYVMGDYFFKLKGDSTAAGSQYASVRKDDQAFQLRRLYLIYNHTISDWFAAQFLLEGNDKTFTDGKHGVFVKTAYLEWKELLANHSLFIGLVPTPTWSILTEPIWNYRSIEKTILDFRGMGVASDIGVQLRGRSDARGSISYVVMVGNGTGQRPENNRSKKYYASVSAKPSDRFVLETYADFEPTGSEQYVLTLRGFAAYQSEHVTAGVEVFQQRHHSQLPQGRGKTPFGLSTFVWGNIAGDLRAFGRFDLFDPDTKLSNVGMREFFVTTGIDYMPVKDVHFMPNVWMNFFASKSSAQRSQQADIVVRLSFFYLYR